MTQTTPYLHKDFSSANPLLVARLFEDIRGLEAEMPLNFAPNSPEHQRYTSLKERRDSVRLELFYELTGGDTVWASRLELRGNYVLDRKYEVGFAARKNRGRFSGQKTHHVVSQYVVAVLRPQDEGRTTYGAAFLRTGSAQLYSCWPVCGCTQGQHAGRPAPALTQQDITCSKCQKEGTY